MQINLEEEYKKIYILSKEKLFFNLYNPIHINTYIKCLLLYAEQLFLSKNIQNNLDIIEELEFCVDKYYNPDCAYLLYIFTNQYDIDDTDTFSLNISNLNIEKYKSLSSHSSYNENNIFIKELNEKQLELH